MKTDEYEYQFVEEIPETVLAGVLFVSTDYATAVHLCACGCGVKVVTPLAPSDWSVTFNGVSVGLSPSIGNWSFPCRSHYWIRNGRVIWSTQWTEKKIQANREADWRRKEEPLLAQPAVPEAKPTRRSPLRNWLRRYSR